MTTAFDARFDLQPSPSRSSLLILAVAYAILTFAFLGGRSIKRVQEARVLETSRQMLDAPDWHGWIVPQVNGETRLRKPPLTYWYTAGAFKIGGVNDWSGRLPTLMVGWSCVVVMFFFGSDLLGRRGGFLAAAVLASSTFFVRFIRSAETDVPAMLGVIFACWAITRGALRPRGRIWFHIAALGIALSAMSKGAPAIFPLVFIGLLCLTLRSWLPLTRFVLSGAPLTALVLIIPWFAFALADSAGWQIEEEVKVVTTGSNHFGFFWSYFPTLPQIMLPWTPILIAACFARSLRQTPIDVPLRVALCLLGCVALPLCVTFNVQAHYLLPTLPGFALLIAWAMTRALEAVERRDPADPTSRTVQRVLHLSFVIACGVCVTGGVAILVTMKIAHRNHLTFADVAAASALVAAGLCLWLVGRNRNVAAQVSLWCALMVLSMPIVIGWWSTEIREELGPKTAATALELFGDRTLVYWGAQTDPALSFNLRRTLLCFTDTKQLLTYLDSHPDAVVIHKFNKRSAVAPPGDLVARFIGHLRDDEVEFLERKR